jgi:hypothetical protein
MTAWFLHLLLDVYKYLHMVTNVILLQRVNVMSSLYFFLALFPSAEDALEYFLCTFFNTASSADPSDYSVSADAGIEPRTVAHFGIGSQTL